MFPGDSLVDKIFEEGIKNTKAFIIILSKNSVEKPWVKEELNKAVVDRINKKRKIIPVVIDDCVVPEVLQSTLWIKIDNINSYDESLDRILHSILDTNDKPPIGKIPKKFKPATIQIKDLNPTDFEVLKTCCKEAIKNKCHICDAEPIIANLEEKGYNLSELNESFGILNDDGYLDAEQSTGCKLNISHLIINTTGMEMFLQNYDVHEYTELQKKVAFEILNNDLRNNDEIAKKLGYPLLIISHIFEVFENNSFIEYQEIAAGFDCRSIYNIKPQFKRWLNS